jgi:L-cystine transport system permease protein
MYKFDYLFFLHELWVAITYIPLTLELAIVPMLFGLVVGTILAICRIQNIPVLNTLIKIYILIFRSMPMVLMILILYFSFMYGFDTLASFFHLKIRSGDIPAIVLAFIILSVVSVAFMAESIRGALQSVQKGQIEAAHSIGMRQRTIYRRIVIPQALPVAIPILGNTFIGLTKGTALVYMVGVTDLITGVKIEANASYRYLEAYIAIAIIYWLLCIVIEQGIRLLSHKVNILARG